MKTPEEYLKDIVIDKGNLQYILETGRINGSLYTSIIEVIKRAKKDAYNQALHDLDNTAFEIQGLIIFDNIIESLKL